jgi:hypothetical protein
MMSRLPIVFPMMHFWLPEKDESPNSIPPKSNRDMVNALSKGAWHYVVNRGSGKDN